jgi:predicted nucleic acid-binding protein
MEGRVTGDLIAVVVDANVMMALAIPLPYTDQAVAQHKRWQEDGVTLYAPLLWEYEFVSALRKGVALGVLLEEQVASAITHVFALDIESVSPEPGDHGDAIRWAARLGYVVAYDAQYLALAERMGADFWTADRRLATRARETGADWVRCLLDGPQRGG